MSNKFYIAGFSKWGEVFVSATIIKDKVDYFSYEPKLTDDLLLTKEEADLVFAYCSSTKGKYVLRHVKHLAIVEHLDADLLTMAEQDKHDDIVSGYDDHGQVQYEDGEQVDGDDYLDDRDEDELV